MMWRLLTLIALSGWSAAAYCQAEVAADTARSVVERIASCKLERDYPSVIKALSTSRAYKRDKKALGKLKNGNCLGDGVSVTLDAMIFRGALFRALVRKNYVDGPATLSAIPYVETGEWASTLNFAGCVVRADPANAYNVVFAPAGSTAESAAFDTLEVPIRTCMPWETMSWTKADLIYLFSEAYYHEAGGVTSASLN